jgi:hypothetical protein
MQVAKFKAVLGTLCHYHKYIHIATGLKRTGWWREKSEENLKPECVSNYALY